MTKTNQSLINHNTQNLKLNIDMLGYNTCNREWGKGFIPNLNKFYLITKGNLYFNINGIEFYAQNNYLLFLPLHTKQIFYSVSNTFEHYWCHFSASVEDNKQLDLFDLIKMPYYIQLEKSDTVEKIFKEMINCFKNNTIRNTLKLKTLLNELIIFYMDNAKNTSITFPNKTFTKLSKVLDYVNKNLDKKLTVNELAKIVHLHPNYFVTLFKSYFGQSPIRYVNNLKIKKAKLMLA